VKDFIGTVTRARDFWMTCVPCHCDNADLGFMALAMLKIDAASNSITSLTTRTFGDLGFSERKNLQEWIAKEPSCLGEELLIIQKEFSGFSHTHERLDILALDKQGSLVLIENKLDDTGRDVTWQALKYASYCSRLSKENVRSIYQEFLAKTDPSADARELITEFLEADDYEEVAVNKGFTQRIILIAANFRKEVTSTVPYSMDEQHFLNIEQIIPTKDVEEFMIGLADKALDEIEEVTEEKNRHNVRREFWTKVIRAIATKTSLFKIFRPEPKVGFRQVRALEEWDLILSLVENIVERNFISIGVTRKRTNSYSTSFMQKKSLLKPRSTNRLRGSGSTTGERVGLNAKCLETYLIPTSGLL
jgi:hypothetical protein